MINFFTQVLSALVTTFIVAMVKIVIKYIKQIPKEKIYNILLKIFLVFMYLILFSNFIITLKVALELSFGVKYVIGLVGTSYCFYSVVNCSFFIKNFFSKDFRNQQK